jgi:hypothetical protein
MHRQWNGKMVDRKKYERGHVGGQIAKGFCLLTSCLKMAPVKIIDIVQLGSPHTSINRPPHWSAGKFSPDNRQ